MLVLCSTRWMRNRPSRDRQGEGGGAEKVNVSADFYLIDPCPHCELARLSRLWAEVKCWINNVPFELGALQRHRRLIP